MPGIVGVAAAAPSVAGDAAAAAAAAAAVAAAAADPLPARTLRARHCGAQAACRENLTLEARGPVR